MSVLGRILFTGEVEPIFTRTTQLSFFPIETSIPCQYDIQNIDLATWGEVGEKVTTHNLSNHHTCTAGPPRYLNAYTETKRNPWENCSVRYHPPSHPLLEMYFQLRKDLSNCELVYEDADLSSAHAVVFHLHKVNKLCVFIVLVYEIDFTKFKTNFLVCIVAKV